MSIKNVGVVGAGTMGQSIAEMLAIKGLDVMLLEKTAAKLDHAWEAIVMSLDKQIEKWAITRAEKKLILSRIHKTEDFQVLSECDLIIETITEDLSAKKSLFADLDQICPPHIILASNTSTLSLTELAADTRYPERVVGLHFLLPVAKIDLVEIVNGLKT